LNYSCSKNWSLVEKLSFLRSVNVRFTWRLGSLIDTCIIKRFRFCSNIRDHFWTVRILCKKQDAILNICLKRDNSQLGLNRIMTYRVKTLDLLWYVAKHNLISNISWIHWCHLIYQRKYYCISYFIIASYQKESRSIYFNKSVNITFSKINVFYNEIFRYIFLLAFSVS